MAYVAGEKIGIGRILSRGFLIFRQNLVLFLAIGFAIGSLPSFLFEMLLAWAGGSFTAASPDQSIGSPGGIVSSILYWFAQAVIIHMALLSHAGHSPAWKESSKYVGRLFPKVIGASILAALAMIFGFVFLVVPGVIVAIMFSVSTPVILQEELGATASLKRSRELTRGSRWSIFLLLLVAGLVAMVLMAPVFAAVFLAPTNPLLLGLTGMLSNTIMIPLLAAITASLYIELREVREGHGTGELAEIFA